MIYKEKVQGLVEVLNGKLRIIEGIATGAIKVNGQETIQIIAETKKVVERIGELISIERN
jgi:putative sterol carrier protein